jgi:hypothetical protein
MRADYNLAWILPFVRESLRGRGEFNFDNYIEGLWSALERAGVPKIEKRSPLAGYIGCSYDVSQAPYELRSVATEAFFYVIQKGFAIPGPPTNLPGFRNQGSFYLTPHGLTWASGNDPLPEDYGGYLKLLHSLVPSLDSTVEQYVSEGISSFIRGTYFAAAVMIGAASEKAIYLLAESMSDAFKDAAKQTKLKKLLSERRLNSLFIFVQETIQQAHARKAIPYPVAEGSFPHMMSLMEAIRMQRNDAVHPMSAQVSDASVRHSFGSFPHALAKVAVLQSWFLANPKSI